MQPAWYLTAGIIMSLLSLLTERVRGNIPQASWRNILSVTEEMFGVSHQEMFGVSHQEIFGVSQKKCLGAQREKYEALRLGHRENAHFNCHSNQH